MTTQERLDALEEAIASGSLSVRHGDKSVQYRSMDELLKAYAFFARKLANEAASTRGGSPDYSLADFRE